MKAHYDFSHGQRGRIVPAATDDQNTIAVQIVAEVMDWFLAEADRLEGKVTAETLVNEALRRFIADRQRHQDS
jgi:hypothetical protein